MKTTINFNDFRNEFKAYDRDNFSTEGLEILFNYLEALEQDTGEEMELDVIALCCDYAEGTPEQIASDYGIEADEDEELADAVRGYLETNTTLIGETAAGSMVYCQAF